MEKDMNPPPQTHLSVPAFMLEDGSPLVTDLIQEFERARRQWDEFQKTGVPTGTVGAYDTCFSAILKKHITSTPGSNAAQPILLGEVGEQFVRDAIRSAYDRGYNDARLPLNLPRDHAPGYRGRDMSEDIAVDYLARLRRLPPPAPNVAPPVVTGQMEIEPDVTAADLGANTEPADDDDETYQIGVRDGYSQAVQEIDRLTGGDGEYRYCTDHDPDRHTPGPAEMIQRIVDRFEVLNLLDEATKTGRDQQWGITPDTPSPQPREGGS